MKDGHARIGARHGGKVNWLLQVPLAISQIYKPFRPMCSCLIQVLRSIVRILNERTLPCLSKRLVWHVQMCGVGWSHDSDGSSDRHSDSLAAVCVSGYLPTAASTGCTMSTIFGLQLARPGLLTPTSAYYSVRTLTLKSLCFSALGPD